MLRLPRNSTIDIISDHINNLRHSESAVLQIPSKLPPGVGFAATGLMIQFIAEWSRQHEIRTLQIAGLPAEGVLSRLAEEPHGSAAIYFADLIKGNVGFSATRNEARRYLIPIIQAMQAHDYRATSGTRGVHLCCFNGSVNEYIGPLYSRKDETSLRNVSDFIDLTRSIIAAFEPIALRRLPPESLRFISSVIYELFSNTHDHARSDEQSNPYPNGNIRGIVARTVEYRADSKESHINTHLSRYMAMATAKKRKYAVLPEINKERVAQVHAGRAKAQSERTTAATSTRFLELTIYDTGPGLARRWATQKLDQSSQQFSFQDELKFVSACFEIGNTTKSISGVGQGLRSSVLSLKKLGAFLALRTGKAFLYQDFLNKSTESFSPDHWYPESPEQTYLPGTSYTIAIPLSGDIV